MSDVNKRFDELGATLESLGIDLSKYTELEQARGIALAEAVYGFSPDEIVDMLKAIMDAPSAMEAAQQFTLSFMEQVREGMVNSITSAFTDMLYSQLMAPLAEQFLAGAETPAELLEASKQYIGAVTSLMRDPETLTSLRAFGAAMWEVNKMIPSAEYLATSTDMVTKTIDYLGAAIREYPVYAMKAGDILIYAGKIAGDYLIRAAQTFANVGGTAVPMQHGAIVNRPTYSLIGEAGYPEVVLPLDSQHKLRARLEGNGGQEVTVTIPLTVVTEDGRTLKQETIQETIHEIKERSRRREFVIHASGIAY